MESTESGPEYARVTVRQLARAESTCPRRLDLDHQDTRANRGANRGFRVRAQIEADARLAHTGFRRPDAAHFRATDDLFPEERQVYETAARWYVALFGDEPMAVADIDTHEFETIARRTGVRLVGGAGLALEAPEGRRELRMLSIGDRSTEELLDSASVRFALLRRPDWTRLGPLRVVRADLLGGWAVAADTDGAELWPDLREWLQDRVSVIRAHADKRRPRAGWECARCPYIAGCAALR
ncbi:MAG: hypothetical protein JJE46_01680 [Acidimicrobiia bacterium]|nr:hypothetical protein [Acidimicrobiia bacterium]